MGEPAENEGLVLREGAVVEGKYRLVRAAGEGAMGFVWQAEHVTLGHPVAIKFLHGSVANAAEPRARFEREARLAARLGEASRHITRVMDHGVTVDGTPFLVMEFLHGEGLEVRLKRERRLPLALVAKITAQLCRALVVAHQGGVIHRDLKPANVFLCEDPDNQNELLVKLLDFGVAKAEGDENQATRAGALIGTPNYMSPEQITGEPLDARSDLWAAAAIVYRMAVGRAPFGSGALSELAMRIVATEPPTPTALAPDLPHEFDLWVQKGLAKKPPQRFQTARELADSMAMVAGISSAGVTGSFSASAAEALALQLGDSVGGLQSTVNEPRSYGAAQSAPGFAPLPPAPSGKGKVIVGAFLAACVVGGIFFGVRLAQQPPPASAAGAKTTETKASAQPEPKPEAKKDEPKVEAKKDDDKPADTVKSAEPVKPAAGQPGFQAPPSTGFKPGVGPAKPAKTAEPTSSAPPPPPPATTAPPKKPDDLWNKKDEM